MNKSACSAVICQPGGHKQKHDISNDHSNAWVDTKIVSMNFLEHKPTNFYCMNLNDVKIIIVVFVIIDKKN